jgi:hypothetical protein
MAFVSVKITKTLPATVVVGTEYTIEGTAKIQDAIGALPWVYAELQHKEWNKPNVVESVEFARGFPIPISGTFSIKWTPTVEGIFEYTVIATPAPLAISAIKGLSEILTFPIMARSSPVLKVTTGEAKDVTSGLTITSPVTQVTKKVGDTLDIVVKFSYQGPGGYSGTLKGYIYKYTGIILDRVTLPSTAHGEKAITITEAATEAVTQEATVSLTIPDRGGETFGVLVELGSETKFIDNMVVVVPTTHITGDLTITSYE